VTLGRRGREAVEITGGIGPGERVLLKGTGGEGGTPSGFRLGSS